MLLRKISKYSFSIQSFNTSKEALKNLKNTKKVNMMTAINQAIDQNMELNEKYIINI